MNGETGLGIIEFELFLLAGRQPVASDFIVSDFHEGLLLLPKRKLSII